MKFWKDMSEETKAAIVSRFAELPSMKVVGPDTKMSRYMENLDLVGDEFGTDYFQVEACLVEADVREGHLPPEAMTHAVFMGGEYE